MFVDEFDYHLPEELIAQQPLPERSQSRMLVVYKGEGRWEDRAFVDFPNYVRPGDCLILNHSRVIPSRLFARRMSGTAQVEVFLLHAVSGDPLTWVALVRPGKRIPVGEKLRFDESLQGEVIARGEHGERTIRFSGTSDLLATLERIGHVPLPPYIKRPDGTPDRERYQTVYARERGSVAAPTAGLHFTPEVLAECSVRGAVLAAVTLHVGLGTFAPLHHHRVEDNTLHTERYQIDADSFAAIRGARRRIAVGTTSVRAVESAYAGDALCGETSIFLYPGRPFRAIDALLTNFHLPKSSLIMLVCGLAGRELILDAYAHAVRERYRFFSYGDCMLVV
ncbi:MAG TPA: tRNA preQ1(34) S-adenosylmethionine ribosyltransferase-isomerase QueA [Burkholderiales bacterium]|nr:tRNA preQ1(34) S-adenosylmethionine ribosyltransferase-isomerase QueA [Burkholderiales bacterium]